MPVLNTDISERTVTMCTECIPTAHTLQKSHSVCDGNKMAGHVKDLHYPHPKFCSFLISLFMLLSREKKTKITMSY